MPANLAGGEVREQLPLSEKLAQMTLLAVSGLRGIGSRAAKVTIVGVGLASVCLTGRGMLDTSDGDRIVVGSERTATKGTLTLMIVLSASYA